MVPEVSRRVHGRSKHRSPGAETAGPHQAEKIGCLALAVAKTVTMGRRRTKPRQVRVLTANVLVLSSAVAEYAQLWRIPANWAPQPRAIRHTLRNNWIHRKQWLNT